MSDTWRKYQVEAESVADFLDRYYKPDRYTDSTSSAATIL